MKGKVSQHGYFIDPEKIWHIFWSVSEEDEKRVGFYGKGVKVHYAEGHQYHRGYWGI